VTQDAHHIALLLAINGAHAEPVVRITIGHTAGGSSDLSGRLLRAHRQAHSRLKAANCLYLLRDLLRQVSRFSD
jgi:hypothetical protein